MALLASSRAVYAANNISIPADIAVQLTGTGLTVTLAAGSTLVSFSAGSTTLTLNLDSSSNVTVKSNNLYTLANSQSLPTQCAGTNYSYVDFTSTSTQAVIVTPTNTPACLPNITAFGASPSSITSGQSSTLSWNISNATSVSLDNSLGAQSNLTSGSVNVSPNQTTTYTLTAANSSGTSTAQTTVTVTSSGGGGGGGSFVPLPTISSFMASPADILAGQSSALFWSVTNAARIGITPVVGSGTLNPLSGTASTTPATTTIYTLTAFNAYGQSVTATTTVSVMASNAGSQPSPTAPQPPNEPTQPPTGTAPAYCLVNNTGTFYLILRGIRHGITDPGMLYSYGYGFYSAIPDTTAYQELPTGTLLSPDDGALVKTTEEPTVYVIADGQRHGFTSASVFLALGFKWSSILVVTSPELNVLPLGAIISNGSSSHLRGVNASSSGTVYYLGDSYRYPYPSLSVYNSWNLANEFSTVVPANSADLALPLGPNDAARTSCSG